MKKSRERKGAVSLAQVIDLKARREDIGIEKSAPASRNKGRPVDALAAAYALAHLYPPEPLQRRKHRALQKLVRNYFRDRGVCFDGRGRPYASSRAIDPAEAVGMHAEAARRAFCCFETISKDPSFGTEAGDGYYGADLVTVAFSNAFNDGADFGRVTTVHPRTNQPIEIVRVVKMQVVSTGELLPAPEL